MISSFVEKQSWSSITSTSSIPSSACASARSAATRDMSKPTTMIERVALERRGEVGHDRLAGDLDRRSHRSCSSTKRSEATIAQPAPSEVGEHWSFVSGAKISRDSWISWSE